jgi:hypothetical protein
MNKVTINLQVFEPGIRGFQAEWDRPRKPTFRYGSDKVGEAAAEEAFFLTNAPLELLSKDQVNIIKHYKIWITSLVIGTSWTIFTLREITTVFNFGIYKSTLFSHVFSFFLISIIIRHFIILIDKL